jgi:L-asparaginase II
MSEENGYPQNPVLVRFRRGGEVESVHRGAWVLVDGAGHVQAGDGAFESPFFARSSVKAFQALPLFDTGAAERFAFDEEELALALASHNGERCHTDVVRRTLRKLGLGEADLLCGPQIPEDAATRRELFASGEAPGAIHNNCSGKHAGFLALARTLDVPVERYLDPSSEVQQLVRAALAELTGVRPAELVPAVDGCSAPTYRLALTRLATAFARLTNPEGLSPERREHCRRLTDAVARHPVLIAGSRGRLCTDLARAGAGRLFPKVGAEAVYAVGVRGADRALAVKIDDGSARAIHALVPALLSSLGFLSEEEALRLAPWTERDIKNRAGLVVGRIETVVRR